MSGLNQHTYNEAKAYVQKTDKNGVSLYDTITNMILQMMDEKPSGAQATTIDDFKQYFINNQVDTFAQKKGEFSSNSRKEPLHPEKLNRAHNIVDDLIMAASKTNNTSNNGDFISSLLNTKRLLSYEGVGLSEDELYLIGLSMNNFNNEKKFKTCKLFGKIYGTYSDYIIMQTEFVKQSETVKPTDEQLYDPDYLPSEEGSFKGCNRYSYWVCEFAGAEWKLLPDVSPQQINVARKINQYLTGDLSRNLEDTYPSFPGTEANYLRAQIARIQHGASIAPTGYFKEFEKEEEEEEEEELEEGQVAKEKPRIPEPETMLETEYEAKDIADFMKSDAWSHYEKNILLQGRCYKWVTPKPKTEGDEDEDEDADDEGEEGENAKDPEIPILRAANEDRLFKNIKPPKIPKPPKPKTDDDEDDPEEEPEEEEEDEEEGAPSKPGCHKLQGLSFNLHSGKNETGMVAHSFVTVKNSFWPGHYTYINSDNTFGSIYIGNGLKQLDSPYTPPLPPPVLMEAADLKEVQDPRVGLEKALLNGEELPEDDAEDKDGDDDDEEDDD